MVINPHTLDESVYECPNNCPFLGMRAFMPKTIPFYCNQYDTFLGATPTQKVLRCAKCRGVQENITQTGLTFIDAFPIDHYTAERNKTAFLRLDYGFQKMFVDIVSQTGAEIILESDEEDTPNALSDKILKARKGLKDKYGSPEVQGFKALMDASGLPLMTRPMKTLLTNLFMVLDKSEKEMLNTIMQSPKRAQSFLENFQKQPQDADLLKNVRALVYDYDRRRQLEQARQQAMTIDMNRNRQLQRDQQKLRDLHLREKMREQRQKLREHSR